MTTTARRWSGVLLLAAALGGLTGCGGAGDGSAATAAPRISVQVGDQRVDLDPTQFCLDGDGQRYRTSPPIIEALPDSSVTITVPRAVAAGGWGVQVFDQELEEKIGQVDVAAGTTTLGTINTSDVVPATFYLVVVQDADPAACDGLSGAWPVGFIRADPASVPATPTPTAG